MSSVAAISDHPAASRAAQRRISLAFRGWQCRIRELSARRHEGRPSAAMMPQLTLRDRNEPLGHVITLLNKLPQYSRTDEFRHLYRRTHDPRIRREDALKLIASTYYQDPGEFTDVLTATFAPGSKGAETMLETGHGVLEFAEFAQEYRIPVQILRLLRTDPLHRSTYWHNALFNPSLDPELTVVGFYPDWSTARSNP